ncbi:hypothetical protein FGADI_9096 [Fusarium gaditjirri]|uniref:RanBP2-type domain-containing protein n=1 Tax=Fusarium gaditjirri TaxID=282569 RepID=A0A8H4T0Q9_9HYPO|nr:hypothetical protein FGADI_9096 [Fusarium gaditjirri]
MRPTKPDSSPPDLPPLDDPDTPPTSTTFTGATYGTRPDHVAWKCHRGFFCNVINPLWEARCATCHQERAFPADALNAQHQQIGWLQSVDLHGNEKWLYFNPEILDQLRRGVMPDGFVVSSPAVSWKSGGIDGLSSVHGRPVSEGSDDVGIGPANSAPVFPGAGNVRGINREEKRMRTGDGFEVSHMERWISGTLKQEVDDEDLEEPGEQLEGEGESKGSAAGDGSGSKRKSQ